MHFVILHFSMCLLRDVVEGWSCLERSLGGMSGWEGQKDSVKEQFKSAAPSLRTVTTGSPASTASTSLSMRPFLLFKSRELNAKEARGFKA